MIRLQLAQDGRIVDARGRPAVLAPRDALLVAWLAIEGPTRRSRLAALLWPAAVEDVARNALRQRLFQLRRRFGPGLLVETDGILALGPQVRHDLQAGGQLLCDLDVELGPELAHWLATQREQRLAQRCRALAQQADLAEQAQDWVVALEHAKQLLALMPLSEDGHRRLMRLHYLAGDRAAALLAFDCCEAVLKHEVGTAPDAQTLALLHTVTAADTCLCRPSGRPPVALHRPPRLVGRDHLHEAVLEAVRARRTAVLGGEAGIGKTHLLLDLAARCRQEGLPVLEVRARAGDSVQPLALASRWLQALLAVPGVAPDAAERNELARLLPALGRVPSGRDDQGLRLRQAMQHVLQQATNAGLRAVLVDDLHAADPSSLLLLQPLVGVGCAWVLAARLHELSPNARAWIDTLGAGADGVLFMLHPLSEAEVADLLGDLALPGLGDAAAAAGLVRHTGGNPLFILETLREALRRRTADPAASLAWPVAPSVLHLIGQRLARLSPLAQKLARCAAIAGPDHCAGLAASVLGLRPLDLSDAWAELEAADVLRDPGFAHDLIAEAARAAVPVPIARALHLQIAQWLEQHQGAPARIASHWCEGGQAGRAVPHLLQAARLANTAFHPEAAAGLWEQASALLQAQGDREGAFDALLLAAHARSEQVVDARLDRLAEQLALLADDEGRQAAASLVRLVPLVEARRFDDALHGSTIALAQARRAGRVDVEVELLWGLTVIHWDQGRLPEATACARDALTRLESAPVADSPIELEETRSKILHALGSICSALGRLDEGNRYYEQASAHAVGRGKPGLAASDSASIADNSLAQGDLPAALQYSAQALHGARMAGASPNTLGRVLRTRSHVLALAGDLGGALAALEEAVTAADSGAQRYGPAAQRELCWLQHKLGRSDLARKGLRRLRSEADLPLIDRLLIDACLLHLAPSGTRAAADAALVLDQLAHQDNLLLRAQALCIAAPACEPDRVLPLLGLAAGAARDQGAHGIWIALQSQRMAALRALGRDEEARAAAHQVWQRLEQGLSGIEWLAGTARELCLTWRGHDDALAEAAARRGAAWLQQAAASLPPAWRDNCLSRAPARLPGWMLPGRG